MKQTASQTGCRKMCWILSMDIKLTDAVVHAVQMYPLNDKLVGVFTLPIGEVFDQKVIVRTAEAHTDSDIHRVIDKCVDILLGGVGGVGEEYLTVGGKGHLVLVPKEAKGVEILTEMLAVRAVILLGGVFTVVTVK